MNRLSLFSLLLISFNLVFASSNPDIVVAQDGSGDFKTIQEAIFSVRSLMLDRKVIFVKKGIYHEKLIVPTETCNITLLGEDKDSTIISWADHANMPILGTDVKMGTFRTYTLLVKGHGFHAENITIENVAPQLGQAVALHVEGDRAEFVNCKILGNQDTVYAANDSSRQYYFKCYIEGTTDFIFGSATAFFEECEIRSKKNSYITAPSTAKDQIGYVFYRCHLTASDGVSKVYLGRPWRPYGMSVFIECIMENHIIPSGWNNWNNPENEKTARFIEIDNKGEGSKLSNRVDWSIKGKSSDKKLYSRNSVLEWKKLWWSQK